jgi:L-lactate dehydrogenase complex protein LldF
MAEQKIELFARNLDPGVQQAVHSNSAAGTEKRYSVLGTDYSAPDDLRRLAGQIRQHSIDHLDT